MAGDSFSSLPISKAQIANLDSLGYKKMTPEQAESLPHVLQGKDLIAPVVQCVNLHQTTDMIFPASIKIEIQESWLFVCHPVVRAGK